MLSTRKRPIEEIENDEIEWSLPGEIGAQEESRPASPRYDFSAAGMALLDVQSTPGAAEDEAEQEPEYYIPVLLPSRKRERKHLGKAGKRAECFLCCYCGERNTTLPNEDVQKIVEMFRQYVGRMDSVAFSSMIADYYAEFRTRINSNLLAGERPLPPMTAATVLEHMRKHTADPELKQVVMLEELQEIRQELLKVLFEENNKKKIRRINKTNLDGLEKVMKMELVLQQKDMSKFAFFAAGARVNGMNQGPVATSTKTLFDCWRRARP